MAMNMLPLHSGSPWQGSETHQGTAQALVLYRLALQPRGEWVAGPATFFHFILMICRWKKAVDAVHRAKLALMLTDFAGIQSAVPSIVARYKVSSIPPKRLIMPLSVLAVAHW